MAALWLHGTSTKGLQGSHDVGQSGEMEQVPGRYMQHTHKLYNKLLVQSTCGWPESSAAYNAPFNNLHVVRQRRARVVAAAER